MAMESVAQIIPGYKSQSAFREEVYWHSARSSCCKTWLVRWEPELKLFVHWAGWEDLPGDGVFCRSCGERVWPP